MSVHLYIVAKFPFVGKVKTRLGCSLGAARAAMIANHMADVTVAKAEQAKLMDNSIRIRLAVAPDEAIWRNPFRWAQRYDCVPQGAGDLGARLLRLFKRHHGEPVIVIGADTPQFSAHGLIEACRFLRRYDAVAGPAVDGGFWLFGLAQRRPAPGLFENVRWSSDTTLSDTLGSLPSEFSVAQLSCMRDVDALTDYKILLRQGFTRSGTNGKGPDVS